MQKKDFVSVEKWLQMLSSKLVEGSLLDQFFFACMEQLHNFVTHRILYTPFFQVPLALTVKSQFHQFCEWVRHDDAAEACRFSGMRIDHQIIVRLNILRPHVRSLDKAY